MNSCSYTCSRLSPAALKATPTWDIHPFLAEDEPVLQTVESIRRVGILHPPLVVSQGTGDYEFLSGKRQAHVWQCIAPGTDLYYRILPETATPAELLTSVYEEYSCTRTLTAIEQAFFFRLCRDHLPTENARQQLYNSLGLTSKPHAVDRALQLIALGPLLAREMMWGTLPEAVARDLLSCQEGERQALYALFRLLQLGGGKQRRLLSLLRDLAGRKGTDLAELLKDESIQAIVNHPEMNIPQKAHALLHHLQNLRSPGLHRAEQEFTTWQIGLRLPQNCSLEPSPAFERDALSLTIEFADRAHLEKCWQEIRKALLPLKG